MVKVFHCADIHFDAPFSLQSPSVAESRRTELRGVFDSAILYAKTHGVQLFLISGDLFDSENVTADTRELLIRQFASFKDCRFFITPGNHDPLNGNSPYITSHFPDNVHIFGEARETVEIPELGVTVSGQAFTSRKMLSSPVTGYHLNPNYINILVCHGEVTNGISECGPITRKEIAASGFDYIALGHIHKNSGLQRDGATYWCYPGCIEGRSFDELGHKGAMVGTIDKGSAEMSFVRFSRRRYEIAEAVLDGGMTRTDALNAIYSAIRLYTDDTCLRLLLSGSVAEGVNITASDIGKGAELPFSIELIDNTMPEDIYSDAEKSGTLKGVFYTMMKQKLAECEPGSEQYRMIAEATRLGLAALCDRSVAETEGAL